MNIEKIKSEFERLSQIISKWNDNQEVTAIERDLALDKLLKIYELIRFADSKPICAETTATPAQTIPSQEPAQEPADDESDVEVEFIFADDEDNQAIFEIEQEIEQEVDESADQEPEPSAAKSLNDILAATLAASAATTAPTPAAEPAKTEPIIETPATKPEEVKEVEEVEIPAVEPQVAKPEPQPAPKAEPKAARPMNSLFGAEEPRRQPRTKHQRMMSIYNDSESRPEKVVDISKIFDLDSEDEPTPAKSVTSKPIAPKPEKSAVESVADIEPATTIGDVMAQKSQTLADTIAAPTALSEEISHQSIRSLRQGIGLNDKFLMIRDLFDGDADAYDEAIDALDGIEDFDDCLIYIAENFAWNADSEGAKFIMQLLERKLS